MSEIAEGSAPIQESSALTENNQENSTNVNDDFKRDMFKFKERARELEQKLQEREERLKTFEMSEEERKGNYEKVLSTLKDDLRETKKALANKDFTYARTNLESAIKQHAMKQGCKDPDAFLRLIDPAKLELVELDDKYNPSSNDVNSIVNDEKKRFEHIGLFGMPAVKIADATPTNQATFQEQKKTLSQMSTNDLIGEWAKLEGTKRHK